MPKNNTVASNIDVSAAFGYGLMLSLGATSSWIGASSGFFALIDAENLANIIRIVKTAVYLGLYLSMGLIAFFRSSTFRPNCIVLGVLYIAGQSLILASSSFPDLSFWPILAGSAMTFISFVLMTYLWQCYFSSVSLEYCSESLTAGTALSAIFYLLLNALPYIWSMTISAYLLLPISLLILFRKVKRVDYAAPMFADVPKEHGTTYLSLLRGFWKPLACAAAILFTNYLVQALAEHQYESSYLIYPLAMIASCCIAVLLLVLSTWRFLRFDFVGAYRLVFPVMATMVVAIPFCPSHVVIDICAISHAIATLATMMITIQCAQISRENGINVAVLFCSSNVIMMAMFDGGRIAISIIDSVTQPSTLAFAAAMVALWALGIVLFLVKGDISKDSLFANPETNYRLVDFSVRRNSPAQGNFIGTAEERLKAGSDSSKDESEDSGNVEKEQSIDSEEHVYHYRDRLSKQCSQVSKEYGLTAREEEVLELFARGNDLATIAERLVLSENTVRFHRGHIYEKLGIHKRKELIEIVGNTLV